MANCLELAVEYSTDGILFLKNDTITYCNRTFGGFLKSPINEIINTSYFKYLSTTEKDRIRKKIQLGIRFQSEVHLKKNNQENIILEAHFNPVIHKNNDEADWIVVHKQIERNKNLRDSISRLSEHLRLVVESAPLSIWSIDLEGEIQYASEKGLPGLPLKQEEIIGKFFLSLYLKHPHWLETVKSALQGNISYSENNIANKYFQTYFQPLKNYEGKKIGIIGVSIDVTDRIQSEAFKKQLLSVLEATSDVVIIFDNKNINYINKAGKNLLNLRQPKGTGISNIFTPEDWKLLDKKGLSTAEKKGLWHGESNFINTEGATIAISLVLIAHKNESQEIDYYSLIARDIREAKAHEQELKEAKEKAEVATQAKTIFLANMSHEIRTPLNAILGFSEILAQSTDDLTLKDYTQAIKSSGKNLLHLISDILDLSKIESGNLILEIQPTNIAEVLNEIEVIFDLQAKQKQLQFSIQSNIQSQFIHLDATRLRQILFNLTGNAIKYTDKGFVHLICDELIENNLSTLIFKVEDTGRGILPEDQEAIFEAFVQKHDKAGGVGLGLAITKKILIAMGGEISLNSKIEVGSQFKVIIPNLKIEPNDHSYSKPNDNYENINFSGKTVLIVDDIETNIEVLKTFLSSANIKILESLCGKDALKLAEFHQPDLILMDLKMPDIRGDEVTKILKNNPNTQNIPVIIVSAQLFSEEKDKLKTSGANGFLQKPISRNQLIHEIKKHLTTNNHPLIKEENNNFETPPNPQQTQELLNNELNNWNEIKDSYIITDIKNFSIKLLELEKTLKWKHLQNYAEQLHKLSLSCDVEKCHNLLEKYPELIKQISNE